MSYFKPSYLALAALSVAAIAGSGVAFGQSQAQVDISELIKSSQKNVERWQAESNGSPDLPVATKGQRTHQTKAQPSIQAAQAQPEITSSGSPPQRRSDPKRPREDQMGTVYYLLSFSMPPALLSDAIQSLSKNEVAVFRGPVNGETMNELSVRLHKVIGRLDKNNKDKVVNIQIDPTRFKTCAIQAVPATCIMTPSGPMTAIGVMSGDYLIRLGRSADRAVGQTWAIAEIDLGEEIKKRLARVTKEDIQRETVKSVFLNRKYVKLPTAQEEAAFVFDPSVIRTNAVVIEGKVLAQKGQKYNPAGSTGSALDYSYVVFDATSPAQIDAAAAAVSALNRQKKSVRVMVTDFPDHSNGFDVMQQLGRRFGQRITIIDEKLVKALRLRSLPSVVEASPGGMILVNEVRS